MEGHTMQSGPPVSMDVPKFQAYLRQRLVFEHQRVRLERSRRNWRITAMAATALCVFSIARPAIPHRVRDSVATLRGGPSSPDGLEQVYHTGSVPLENSLEASLEQDRALARRLGAHQTHGAPLAEHTFVVSRFPISGGRSVSIYTPISTPRTDGEHDAVYAHDGGVW